MTQLPDVLAAVTLGPDDRLVLVFPRGSFDYAEAEYMDSLIVERGLSGRVVLASGVEDVIVLRATKAEGSTVGQCGDQIAPVISRTPGGPPLTLSCHLASGHSGMHSDGSATWTNTEEAQP